MTKKEQIKAFIEETLLMGQDIVLDYDDDILLTGLINSLGVMRLVSFLQDTFEIEIAPDEVTIDNFQTINAIASFIELSRTSA